jgi:hypothetical protein
MLSPTKRATEKYKTFLVKMMLNNLTNEQTKYNYEHLCDLHILLGLTYILPLLEYVHVLFKFA